MYPSTYAVSLRVRHPGETFLKEVRKGDGRTEFFVGLFCTDDIGTLLPSSLLGSMAELGIDLSLDAYADNEPHNRIRDGL